MGWWGEGLGLSGTLGALGGLGKKEVSGFRTGMLNINTVLAGRHLFLRCRAEVSNNLSFG
jgi:uncharacterized integral membrane protein